MLRTRDVIINECNKAGDSFFLSENDILQLQKHLFMMYKDIESVCRRHNLCVVLAFGNVIGVMRHGGWIPWDDDLDIYMPRKDYEKFIKIYAKELPNKYLVYSLDSSNGPICRFTKIIDTTTVFSTSMDIGPKHHEGVFIDIFPLDEVPANKHVHKIKQTIAFSIIFIQNSIMQNKYCTEIYRKTICSSKNGRCIFRIKKTIGTIFGIIPLRTWFRYLDRLIKNSKESLYVYCGISTKKGWIPMGKDILFPPKRFTFPDGQEAFIPAQAESYLTQVYGDWKKIPDDKDKWHHYCKAFDLKNQEIHD